MLCDQLDMCFWGGHLFDYKLHSFHEWLAFFPGVKPWLRSEMLQQSRFSMAPKQAWDSTIQTQEETLFANLLKFLFDRKNARQSFLVGCWSLRSSFFASGFAPNIVTPDSQEVRLKRRPGSLQGKGDGKAMQWSLEPWNLGCFSIRGFGRGDQSKDFQPNEKNKSNRVE